MTPRFGSSQDADTSPVRIVLIDQHRLLRQGIASLLAHEPRVDLVGEAADAEAAEAVIERVRPDLVVIDLKPASGACHDGLALIARLTSRSPTVKSVVLTSFHDESLIARAARAGARGFVLKDINTDALVRVIIAVAAGGLVFDAAPDIRSAAAWEAHLPEPSRRETQVLALLAEGCSRREVGRTLGIAESTVGFHITNILSKLGAATTTEAVYMVSMRGFI
ncbi:response regulator [Gordonia pseudamarae]|uniref:Response regulator n=1 Tax=Gordonia pseudamarae TaxID=2831662 RepID=A0ABX6IEM9_9ACTN|nr:MULTISPECIES: response regulator transcription factor [Gordonia]MBD0024585.1 response regulator transcription factor [Gordonia sp. (in: high G+C Gram-positive bacteria)]QHN24838.1 response regulator [Gordonia pseudamarae]QHN33771.1 response regulator [Gordonia pseudamarae]